MKLAILSNGEPKMLASAAQNSGIEELLDAVLSVEAVKVFKPHPHVYRLAEERFGLPAQAICFVSSNGWDAYAAKAYGYRVDLVQPVCAGPGTDSIAARCRDRHLGEAAGDRRPLK